ncbi:MAG: hypothetical protein KBA95_06815 [Acidobacteria bacterium]|nr:hypothetical protein [Acidobacteriota bacterium]
MALVIVGGLVTACLLLSQGVHVMRKGNTRPFFQESGEMSDLQLSLKPGARLPVALLYLIPGAAILGLLVLALLRSDRPGLSEWLTDHGFELAGAIFLFVYGLVAILRSQIVLRWIASPYQDPEARLRSSSARSFIRVLGVILSAFGLYILKTL